MVESDPTGTDDKPLEEEKFEELANSEEEEERPELDIPFNERKLLRFFADRAAKKWPLWGSLKLG